MSAKHSPIHRREEMMAMKREGIRERVRTFVLSNDNRTKEKKLQAQMIGENGHPGSLYVSFYKSLP